MTSDGFNTFGIKACRLKDSVGSNRLETIKAIMKKLCALPGLKLKNLTDFCFVLKK